MAVYWNGQKMSEATQKYRDLAIKTVLEDDELLLTSISGTEEISTLFHFDLEMYSSNDSIDPAKIVGLPATVRVKASDGVTRYFNGIISDFSHAGWGTKFVNYRATLVPRMWLLEHSADCRIFQQKSVKEIVDQIFKQHGIQDVNWKLNNPPPKLEYCVQYRETDLNFVSRLLEEEGIFYFFEHQNDKHSLILSDNSSAYLSIPDKEVEFLDVNHTDASKNKVLSWQRTYTMRSGKYAHTDYNFKTPATRLVRERAKKHMPFKGVEKLEVYDYHGRHLDPARGAALAKIRLEEIEAQHDVAKGESTCNTFTAGGKFKFTDHRSEAEIGNSYLLTRVYLAARLDDYLGNESLSFRNSFECIPLKVPFRPRRVSRKPVVEGPQTAIVVGPEGETSPTGSGKDKEIYVDEHARVKVRFHWVRDGEPHGENSSCWIRVSQAWAGNGYGVLNIPRIGHEVIVDFLEGDPDNPIINGRVYNAHSMPNASNAGRTGNTPPADVPSAAVMTSFKSSSVGGVGANEITMNDEGGKEGLFFKAQKDEIHNVGNDRKDNVGNNETRVIGNNQSETVVADRSRKVGGKETVEIVADQSIKVTGNQKIDITATQKTTVGQTIVIEAGTSITLKCGASKIHMNQAGFIEISGTVLAIAGAVNCSMTAPITNVTGAVLLTAVGGVTEVAGMLTQVRGTKVDVLSEGPLVAKGNPITLN
jgi:type VI secretion system secreted protein VgrG